MTSKWVLRDAKMRDKVKKILVMDDNSELLTLLKRMLEHLKFEVVLTTEGAEAIRVYKEEMEKGNPFDLIMVDLKIDDGIGGIETVRTIRKFDPNLISIVSSGELSSDILNNQTKYGFSALLEKPFNLENLKNVVEEVLA